jgi:hypothetical protein
LLLVFFFFLSLSALASRDEGTQVLMLLAGHATTGRVRLQWRVRHLQTQVIKFGFLRIFPKTVHQAVHITVKRICLFLNRPKDCFNIVLCCLKYFGDNLNYKAAKDTETYGSLLPCSSLSEIR